MGRIVHDFGWPKCSRHSDIGQCTVRTRASIRTTTKCVAHARASININCNADDYDVALVSVTHRDESPFLSSVKASPLTRHHSIATCN